MGYVKGDLIVIYPKIICKQIRCIEMFLVSDLTGICFEAKPEYKKLLEEFLKKHGAKRIGKWSKHSKLARIGKISYTEALKLWFKDCGIEDEGIVEKFFEFENSVLRKVLIFKGKEVLKEISKKIKIIGLTDAPKPKEQIIKVLRIGGIDSYFYDAISSHDIKMEKPESFKFVLEKFGKFIFLGHDDDEILGAKKLGIKTIGLKNKNADIIINDLNELIEVFTFLISLEQFYVYGCKTPIIYLTIHHRHTTNLHLHRNTRKQDINAERYHNNIQRIRLPKH